MTNNIRNALGNRGYERTKVYSEDEILAEIEKASVKEQKISTKKQPVVAQSIVAPKTNQIIQPVTFERAFFLKGNKFGKKVDEFIQDKYSGTSAISNVQYDGNVVKGSNPFYVVAVNEALRALFPGVRTAEQGELEFIAKNDSKHPLKLKGNYYEDSALVWRSSEDSNSYLASDLKEQFEKAGKILQEGHAYVIPLNTLNLVANVDPRYKLSFKITDETVKNYFEAPILMSESDQYFSSRNVDKNGLPKKVDEEDKSNEDRQLWTRNSGLSGLYLSRVLDIYSYSDGLAGSNEYGRVVCVSTEGVAKKYGLS